MQAGGVKGNVGQLKHRRAHVDGDTAVRPQLRLNHAAKGLHPNGVFGGEAAVAHKARKTACAVAALLHLGAIGVVNHILKVNAGRRGRPHRQNLVGAHAKMPVGQKAVLRQAEVQAVLGLVEHHKVVARALHFGEWDSHAQNYLRRSG